MNCSLVIRAYNEEDHIGRLLEGIRRQTVEDIEIILVDSGSIDATVAIAEKFGVRVVHIRPEEFTFGRSLNLGLQAASCDLVVIASAHVYPVYPDWLERLLEPFSDPQVALVYGKQRGDERSKFSERQILSRWFPDTSDFQQRHPFCNNANAAIRRELWLEHAYDEALTGLEDLEWARWAVDQGRLLAYAADAEIIHVHAETPRGVLNRYRREAMAFKHLYPEAHFSLYDFFRMAVGNILSDCYHAAREKNLYTNLFSILWFRTAQFWGTYQGYRHVIEWTWQLRQKFYYPQARVVDEGVGVRSIDPIRYDK
jgi:glycosyltransferase involved in cell wall biosynthesis